MSLLIKGMEMPTRCDDCAMGHELNIGTSVTGYGCLAMLQMGDARIRPISCGTKPDWCPLVEVSTPHGRLIDADAIDCNPLLKKKAIPDPAIYCAWAVAGEMPTIIEAEI